MLPRRPTMAFFRVFLQVLTLCVVVWCSPVYETRSREGPHLIAAAASEAPQTLDEPDFVRKAQAAHVAGSNMFAEVMYEGLAGVIQSVMKMVSEKVAEAKNIPLE